MTGAEKAMQHSLDAAAGDADEGPEAGAHVLRPLDQSHSHATWRLSKHRRAPPGIRGRKQGHGPRRRTEKDGALTRPLQLTHLRLGGSLRSPRTIRSFLSSSFLDAATIASPRAALCGSGFGRRASAWWIAAPPAAPTPRNRARGPGRQSRSGLRAIPASEIGRAHV